MQSKILTHEETQDSQGGAGGFFQQSVRLPLPIVDGSKEYRQYKRLLERMDEILVKSGVDDAFVQHELRQEQARVDEIGKPLTDRRRASVQRFAIQTLRCAIARILSGESHRLSSDNYDGRLTTTTVAGGGR